MIELHNLFIFKSKIGLQVRIEFRLVFGQFLISSRSEKGHEPSLAENPSARATARASSARTHHYYIPYVYKTSHLQVIQFCFATIYYMDFMFEF